MLAGTRYRKPAKGKGVGRRKPFTLTRVNLELVKGGREAVALVPVLARGKEPSIDLLLYFNNCTLSHLVSMTTM